MTNGVLGIAKEPVVSNLPVLHYRLHERAYIFSITSMCVSPPLADRGGFGYSRHQRVQGRKQQSNGRGHHQC